jgi:hypothetical protein
MPGQPVEEGSPVSQPEGTVISDTKMLAVQPDEVFVSNQKSYEPGALWPSTVSADPEARTNVPRQCRSTGLKAV